MEEVFKTQLGLGYNLLGKLRAGRHLLLHLLPLSGIKSTDEGSRSE